MADKTNDWHIWKANENFFILPATEKPHDHIDPKIPAEIRATIYGVNEKTADTVMAMLSKRKCNGCHGEGKYLADPQDTEKSTCLQCRGTGKGY